jgi:hypothetical protein
VDIIVDINDNKPKTTNDKMLNSSSFITMYPRTIEIIIEIQNPNMTKLKQSFTFEVVIFILAS